MNTTTALIVGDVQRGIVDGYPFARRVVPPLTALLPRAREAGVLVVLVRFALRDNGSDLPADDPLYRSFFDAGTAFHDGAEGTGLALPAAASDVVVVKRRASAFAGTDLDLVLRSRGIRSVAVAGVATSAMVTATCYDAADRGYRVTVLRDGCADADGDVHDFLLDKLFPARGFAIASCAGWPGAAA